MSWRTMSQHPASRSADGKTWLEDCAALTSSLGWTARPSRSDATWASTSLAFMLVLVPDPVWNTSRGKWSSNAPKAISEAASWMATATSFGITRIRPFTVAATPLMEPSAWISSGGTRSPEMGKFSIARWVCAPHRAVVGTRTSPRESCSTRTSLVWSSGEGGVVDGGTRPRYGRTEPDGYRDHRAGVRVPGPPPDRGGRDALPPAHHRRRVHLRDARGPFRQGRAGRAHIADPGSDARHRPPAPARPPPAAADHPRRSRGLSQRPLRRPRPVEERQHRRRRGAPDVP